MIRQFEKDKQGCTGGCATSGTHHLEQAARPVINKTIQRTIFSSAKLIDVVENARATQLKPGSQLVGDSRPSTDNSGDTQTQLKVADTTNTPGTETSVNNKVVHARRQIKRDNVFHRHQHNHSHRVINKTVSQLSTMARYDNNKINNNSSNHSNINEGNNSTRSSNNSSSSNITAVTTKAAAAVATTAVAATTTTTATKAAAAAATTTTAAETATATTTTTAAAAAAATGDGNYRSNTWIWNEKKNWNKDEPS